MGSMRLATMRTPSQRIDLRLRPTLPLEKGGCRALHSFHSLPQSMPAPAVFRDIFYLGNLYDTTSLASLYDASEHLWCTDDLHYSQRHVYCKYTCNGHQCTMAPGEIILGRDTLHCGDSTAEDNEERGPLWLQIGAHRPISGMRLSDTVKWFRDESDIKCHHRSHRSIPLRRILIDQSLTFDTFITVYCLDSVCSSDATMLRLWRISGCTLSQLQTVYI